MNGPSSGGLKAKIKKQIEFYFSDSNAPRDKFLMEKIKGHPEDKLLAEIDERSVYAKPLPFDCTLEALTAFFGTLGGVKAIRLRRRPDNKDFKGSIFVEMDSAETARQVAAREDVVYEGAVLRMERKVEYLERKKLSRKEKAATKQANGVEATNGEAAAKPAPPQGLAVPSYEPGLVFQFDILPEFDTPDDLHYNDIKSAFGGHEAGIIYVEYNKGAREGFLRVGKAAQVPGCLERKDAEGHYPVAKVKVSLRVLEGEEEKQYYLRRAVSSREAEARGDKRRPERGRGGRFGKRGRMH